MLEIVLGLTLLVPLISMIALRKRSKLPILTDVTVNLEPELHWKLKEWKDRHYRSLDCSCSQPKW